jgi:hypothetical protein
VFDESPEKPPVQRRNHRVLVDVDGGIQHDKGSGLKALHTGRQRLAHVYQLCNGRSVR